MAIPLLPSKLVPWCARFLEVLSAEPVRYLIQPSELAALTDATNLYLESQSAVANPEARTGTLIKARDDRQQAYYFLARSIYLRIQANPQISDAHKVEAGIHVRGESRRVGVPAEAPVIDLGASSGRKVRARLHGTTAGRRAKPAGCFGAYLWSFVGENHPENLSDWTFHGTTTRPTFDIEFPPALPGGSKVWICAAWLNPHGQLGPVCDPVSTHTLFGTTTASGTRGLQAAA